MRLTEDKLYLNSIRFGVLANFTPFCGEERAKEANEFLGKVFDKLAAYEDTGLEPEEIQILWSIANEHDRNHKKALAEIEKRGGNCD